MTFNTNYNRKSGPGEDGMVRNKTRFVRDSKGNVIPNTGPNKRDKCHVEPGAISIRERIMAMQLAGAKLQLARAEMYDYQSEQDVVDDFEVKINRYNSRLDLLREARTLSTKLANRAQELAAAADKDPEVAKEDPEVAKEDPEVAEKPEKA